MVHSEGRTQERINPKKYQNAMCVVVWELRKKILSFTKLWELKQQ